MIEFSFPIPMKFRDAALGVMRELLAHTPMDPERVEKVIRAVERAHAYTETRDIYPFDAWDVRVPIDDIEADADVIEGLMEACHRHSVKGPMRRDQNEIPDSGEQLDWEAWSWDVLHELHPFRNMSIVDHLAALGEAP